MKTEPIFNPGSMLEPEQVRTKALEILENHRIMAVSTVRPDGWPQTTIVGYVNEGLDVYFLVHRKSQKRANISLDGRISFAVGDEPRDIHEANAVYAAAMAEPIVDESQRQHAWELLQRRHVNLVDYELPSEAETTLMRAVCRYVSVVDYTKGLGHHETLAIR